MYETHKLTDPARNLLVQLSHFLYLQNTVVGAYSNYTKTITFLKMGFCIPPDAVIALTSFKVISNLIWKRKDKTNKQNMSVCLICFILGNAL